MVNWLNWVEPWARPLLPAHAHLRIPHPARALSNGSDPKVFTPISRNRIAAGWWAEHANAVEFVCLLMLRAVFTCKGAESVLSPRQTSQLPLRVRLNFLWTPDRHRVPVDEPSSSPPSSGWVVLLHTGSPWGARAHRGSKGEVGRQPL